MTFGRIGHFHFHFFVRLFGRQKRGCYFVASVTVISSLVCLFWWQKRGCHFVASVTVISTFYVFSDYNSLHPSISFPLLNVFSDYEQWGWHFSASVTIISTLVCLFWLQFVACFAHVELLASDSTRMLIFLLVTWLMLIFLLVTWLLCDSAFQLYILSEVRLLNNVWTVEQVVNVFDLTSVTHNNESFL